LQAHRGKRDRCAQGYAGRQLRDAVTDHGKSFCFRPLAQGLVSRPAGCKRETHIVITGLVPVIPLA
jgi:hypothetical protein